MSVPITFSAQVIEMTNTLTATNGIVLKLDLNSASPCHLQDGAAGPDPNGEESKTKRSTSNGSFVGYKTSSEPYQRTVLASKSYA